MESFDQIAAKLQRFISFCQTQPFCPKEWKKYGNLSSWIINYSLSDLLRRIKELKSFTAQFHYGLNLFIIDLEKVVTEWQQKESNKDKLRLQMAGCIKKLFDDFRFHMKTDERSTYYELAMYYTSDYILSDWGAENTDFIEIVNQICEFVAVGGSLEDVDKFLRYILYFLKLVNE